MKSFFAGFAIFGAIAVFQNLAQAQTLEESTLTENSVLVRLTADDVAKAKEKKAAGKLGVVVATKMMLLAGVPESVTGKVAALPVWATLCAKYTYDIHSNAKTAKPGDTITLKYSINLEGVRNVWKATEVADHAMPGGEGTKAAIDVANKLTNMVLE